MHTFLLRAWKIAVPLLILLMIGSGVSWFALSPPEVTAQIDNNQPNQAFASVVDCIRMGKDISSGADTHDSPRFVTSCYASRWHEGGYTTPGGDVNNGDALPSDGAITEFGDAEADSTGDLYNVATNGHTTLATVGEVGSVYGLAFQTGTNPAATAPARTERLFAAAYQKRLTRFGSGGPGGIYAINRSNGTSSLYVTVPNVVPGPTGAPYSAGDGSAPRFLNDPAGNVTYTPEMGGLHRQGSDANEEGYVGKAALGDIALDAQERYLYVVNLNNRRIYRFDTWSSTPQATMTLMADPVAALNPCAARGGAQNYRPFGLLLSSTSLYLSGVCSAESTGNAADLAARVDKLDLATNTWQVQLGFSLSDYATQRGVWSGNNLAWQPWQTNGGASYSAPQPILSGLALDEDGNLLLGLRDRYGDLSSNGRTVGGESQGAGQGDLLLAPATGTGNWSQPVATGAERFTDGDTGQGSYPSGWVHGESTWGAIAYVPGTHAGGYGGEVASTAISPYRINSGGVAWWNVSGGNATAREELYQTNSTTQNTFQKAAGLGDLELLCAWRAIGDRIWMDTSGNGIQDSGETNINGVRVQLLNSSGAVIATVTTGSVNGMPGNYRFYVSPFQTYTVRIDPTMFQAGQPLANLAITTQNAGGDDAADSDADASGAIPIPTAGNRDVNLTYDIGLVSGANVRIQKSGPATALPGQSVAYTLSYANDGPAAAQNVTVVDTLPAGLSFASAIPAPSSVSGHVVTWNLGTLGAGTSGAITVNATFSSSASGSYTNQATISTTTVNDMPGDNTTTTTTTVQRPNVWVQKSGPATVTAGNALAYSISYGNNGAVGADNVAVVDTLPAGVSLVSASPSPSSISGQTVTWNFGTVGAGASGSITVNVQSSSTLANGATLTNNASISTTTAGDTPNDNTTSTVTQVQRADVAVTKSSPNTFPVASGQTVTYYLDYTNRGPAAAAGVVLNDTVPSQITNVTWSCASGCSGSGTGNTISINLGTLAAGATGRIVVTGTAQTSVAREDFTNTATITTTTPETDTTNNQSSVPGAVWTTDLQLIKLATPQVAAGATFTATLSYKNNGPAPANSVQLVDTLPSGISLVSANPAPASVSGQTVTWNLGTLADQASGVINLTLRADATLANNTSVINQATISTPTTDRTPSNDTSTATTVVVSRADVQIVKTGPASVSAGNTVTFQLAYTNNGPSVARSVVVSDTLPSDLTFVSATPAPSTNASGVLSWTLGDLAPGASGSITLVMQSAFDQAVATLPVTNTAQIGTSTTDPTPGNNTSSHTVEVQTVDLAIDKTMPAFVIAGVPFTATLSYTNAGPAVATSVTLRDLLPSGLTFVSASPAPSGPGLRWNLGNVPAGGSGTIAVRLQAPTTAISGTSYLNQAIIDTTSSDRDASNDIDQATTTVRPNADLSVLKTGTLGPILSGSPVTYTLSYRNLGPSQATVVQLMDTPPEGFTFVSASPAPASTTGGILTWQLGDLDVGSSGSIEVHGTLTGSGISVDRLNTVTIRSTTPDPEPNNNTSTVTTRVLQPDLSIIKNDGQATAQPGDVLTYILTIQNSGPITATAVTITETPPVPITDPAWTKEANGSYTLLIGDVRPGATLTRTVSMQLPNPLPEALRTVIRNVASVATPCCTDPTPDDNTSTDEDTPLIGRVGDLIWLDTNGNGKADPGEVGLANVPLQLIDPVTGAVLATTTTDANGGYHFDGLRLGDYAVRISPEAREAVYRDYAITTIEVPVTALTPGSLDDDTLDIGLRPNNPTAVVLAYLLIERQDGGMAVRWGTLEERDTKEFRIERTTTRSREGAEVIGTAQSKGSKGADYRVLDANPPTTGPVYYWLIEVETNGHENIYGPAPRSATAAISHVYVPLVQR